MEPSNNAEKDIRPINGTTDETKHSSAIAKADDSLKKLSIKEMLAGQAKNAGKGPKEMSSHRFWGTQPVPRFDDESEVADGPIEPEDLDKVRKEPYPLIDGFEWVTMDMNDATQVEDVYQLLYHNYVEDDEAMFRFKYSASFLNWALKPPGWQKEWHIGIRVTSSRKLVAFITGVPISLRIRSKTVKASEVNFLCVHKKIRSKRLAPILIKEVTRRCNLVGIWQAVYTAGVLLPTPVSTCRYYHRSLDWQKLYEVGFSPLPEGSTKQRQTIKYKLPERTATPGLRPMKKDDLSAVLDLLQRYLSRTSVAQEFTTEELAHALLDVNAPAGSEQVVWSYVVEKDNHITDFFSFYELNSTVIGNSRHDTVRAAYLFYYASETAFQGDGKDQTALKQRLNQLMNDALILAKKANFDVFNALSLLDNPLFLQDQKFGPGDGRLHFYLYNYRTAPIMGGINETAELDASKSGGVGVVML